MLLDDVFDAAEEGRRASPARAVIRGLISRGVEPFWVGIAQAGRLEGWLWAGEAETVADGEVRGEGAAGMGHNWRGR